MKLLGSVRFPAPEVCEALRIANRRRENVISNRLDKVQLIKVFEEVSSRVHNRADAFSWKFCLIYFDKEERTYLL